MGVTVISVKGGNVGALSCTNVTDVQGGKVGAPTLQCVSCHSHHTDRVVQRG